MCVAYLSRPTPCVTDQRLRNDFVYLECSSLNGGKKLLFDFLSVVKVKETLIIFKVLQLGVDFIFSPQLSCLDLKKNTDTINLLETI